MDSAGRIVLANPISCAMFGYEPDELHGQKIEFFLPERFREKHVGQRLSFIEQPRMVPGTGRRLLGMRKDGTEFPVELG